MRLTIQDQWMQWQQVSWKNPHVTLKNGFIENGFCSQCLLCCQPQIGDDPFPMALLPTQIHPQIENDFYMYDSTHASLDERGCKALGPHGCRLPRHARPPACGLFPIVLTPQGLFLYTVCPASLFIAVNTWFNIGYQVKDWLLTLSLEDCTHIAIKLSQNILCTRYIDLHIQVFNEFTKK